MNTSPSASGSIAPLAPTADRITDYDRAQMLVYARLIDADRDGHAWRAAASDILSLEVDIDPDGAELCWQSHLNRALWVTSEGLAASLVLKGVDWEPGEGA